MASVNASSMFIYVLMAIMTALLIGSYIYMGLSSGSTSADASKQISVIAIITFICTFIWTVLSYFIFTAGENMDYTIPYLIISQGIIMFISLFALAGNAINSINS